MNSSRYISIKGGISEAKSTILKNLDDFLEKFYPGEAEIVPEPLNLWTNYRGYNMLGLYYSNPAESCFQFQSVVIQTLAKSQKDKITLSVITERSLDSSVNIFARRALNKGHLSNCEFQILSGLKEIMCEEFKLKTD